MTELASWNFNGSRTMKVFAILIVLFGAANGHLSAFCTSTAQDPDSPQGSSTTLWLGTYHTQPISSETTTDNGAVFLNGDSLHSVIRRSVDVDDDSVNLLAYNDSRVLSCDTLPPFQPNTVGDLDSRFRNDACFDIPENAIVRCYKVQGDPIDDVNRRFIDLSLLELNETLESGILEAIHRNDEFYWDSSVAGRALQHWYGIKFHSGPSSEWYTFYGANMGLHSPALVPIHEGDTMYSYQFLLQVPRGGDDCNSIPLPHLDLYRLIQPEGDLMDDCTSEGVEPGTEFYDGFQCVLRCNAANGFIYVNSSSTVSSNYLHPATGPVCTNGSWLLDSFSCVSLSNSPTSAPSSTPSTGSPSTMPTSLPTEAPSCCEVTSVEQVEGCVQATSGFDGRDWCEDSLEILMTCPCSCCQATKSPTYAPSSSPTILPTSGPTFLPSSSPTVSPTQQPSMAPSQFISMSPSISPTTTTMSTTLSSTMTTTPLITKVPTETPTQIPTIPPCPCRFDVLFLLDASASIGQDRFYGEVFDFIEQISLGFDIGPDPHQSRLAIATFARPSGAILEIPFTNGLNRIEFLDEVRANVTYTNGLSFIGQALNDVLNHFEMTNRDDGISTERVVIHVLDILFSESLRTWTYNHTDSSIFDTSQVFRDKNIIQYVAQLPGRNIPTPFSASFLSRAARILTHDASLGSGYLFTSDNTSFNVLSEIAPDVQDRVCTRAKTEGACTPTSSPTQSPSTTLPTQSPTLLPTAYPSVSPTKENFVYCWGSNEFGQLNVPDDLGQVRAISSGIYHSCAILDTGLVRCWGDNRYGTTTVPADLGPVADISSGSGFSCAITIAGNGKCWGDSRYNQTRIPLGFGNINAISTELHLVCAINASNEVQCWGHVFNGPSPEDIPTNPNDISPAIEIATGAEHVCALDEVGRVTCSGRSASDRLNVPADLEPSEFLCAGYGHTCAISRNGSIACWGWNSRGQTDVPTAVGPVIECSTGFDHTCAVTTENSAVCWGNDLHGQSIIPSDLQRLDSRIFSVSAGAEHSCAIVEFETSPP